MCCCWRPTRRVAYRRSVHVRTPHSVSRADSLLRVGGAGRATTHAGEGRAVLCRCHNVSVLTLTLPSPSLTTELLRSQAGGVRRCDAPRRGPSRLRTRRTAYSSPATHTCESMGAAPARTRQTRNANATQPHKRTSANSLGAAEEEEVPVGAASTAVCTERSWKKARCRRAALR